ncbi:hypothetical protein L0128_08835 [candidate division KSB1 bacterium]|nr:hypothetical protein [candidate division KSB1 bacterium]
MDFEKLDKTALTFGELHDGGDEKAYWLAKSPQARMAAIEIMRRIVYGEAATSQRLQRFFEIAERKKG